MDQQTQTYIVYALLVVLGFVIGRVTARQRPQHERRPKPVETSYKPPAAPLMDRDLESQVVLLLSQRGKIEAIKLYREHTGVGLREAKDTVEAIAARRHLDLR